MKNFTNFDDYIEKLKALKNKIAILEAEYSTSKESKLIDKIEIYDFSYGSLEYAIFKLCFAADNNQITSDDYCNTLPAYKSNKHLNLSDFQRINIIKKVKNFNRLFSIPFEIFKRLNYKVYENRAKARHHKSLHEIANKFLQKEFGIKIIPSGTMHLNSTDKIKYKAKYLLPLDIAKYIFEHKNIAKKYHNYVETDIYCADPHFQEIINDVLNPKTKGKRTMKKNASDKTPNTEKPEDTAIWHNPIKALPKKEREVVERQAKHTKQLAKNDGIPENDKHENDIRRIIRNDDVLLETLLKCKSLAPLIETRITSDWDVELFGNINKANKKLLDEYSKKNYQRLVDRYDAFTIPNIDGEVKKDKAKLRPLLLCKLQKACDVLTMKCTDDISQEVLTLFSDRISTHINMTKRFLQDYNIDFNGCIETKS